MKTNEDYFKMGANAMKGEMAARFAILGKMDLASSVLSMPTPRFQEPEEVLIKESTNDTDRTPCTGKG